MKIKESHNKVVLHIICDKDLNPIFSPQSDYDVARGLLYSSTEAVYIMKAEYEFKRFTQPPEIHKHEQR